MTETFKLFLLETNMFFENIIPLKSSEFHLVVFYYQLFTLYENSSYKKKKEKYVRLMIVI